MEYQFEISRGPVDVRKRKLILNSDYIEFESRHIQNHIPKRIYKREIKDVRIGMRILRGIEFPVGREFFFEFKTSPLKTFKIKFSSSLRNRKNNSLKLFNEINQAMWKLYLNDLLNDYESQFNEGKSIHLAKVELNKNGLTFKKKTSINRKKHFVTWDDLIVTDFHENFYIGSRSDKKVKRLMNVCDDWNAVMLYAFLNARLKK